MGVAAVNAAFEIGNESVLIGMVNNRFVRSPLMECVSRTRAVADALASTSSASVFLGTIDDGSLRCLCTEQDFATAARARGESFLTEWHLFNVLAGHPIPTPTAPKLRIGVLTAGAASPGMNTVVRALGALFSSTYAAECIAVRTALSAGHGVYAIPNGFLGMLKGEISEFSWMTVNGWAIAGGSYLGANRRTIDPSSTFSEQSVADTKFIVCCIDAEAVGEFIQKSNLNALVMIGGCDTHTTRSSFSSVADAAIGSFEGYQTVHMLQQHATKFPALAIPMLCVPASISNALPGTEITIGSDTALNSIIWALDRTSRRTFSFLLLTHIPLFRHQAKRCFVAACVHCRSDGVLLGLPRRNGEPCWRCRAHVLARGTATRSHLWLTAVGWRDTEGRPSGYLAPEEALREQEEEHGSLRSQRKRLTSTFPECHSPSC